MPESQAAPRESSAPRRWVRPRLKARRPKTPCPLLSPPPTSQGHGDNRTLGKILNGDAQRQRQCAGRRICELPARKPAYITPTAIPPNVVQRHRQHHHSRASQLAFRPLRLVASHMKVGNQTIQHEQKQHADPGPIRAGRKDSLPIPPIAQLRESAGSKSTPPPSPRRQSPQAKGCCTKSPSDFFIKNTHAAPSVVPRNGIQYSEKGFQVSSPPFSLKILVYTTQNGCKMLILVSPSFPRRDAQPAPFILVNLHVAKARLFQIRFQLDILCR